MKRTVIVTGAASGIGLATTQALVRQGSYQVVATDLTDLPRAQDLSAVEFVRGDLREPGIQSEVFSAAEGASAAPLYALVNNLGVTPPYEDAQSVTAERWQEMIDLNLTVPFQMCQRAFAAMSRHREGAIVNVSSLAGLAGVPYAIDYVAAKHAVIGVTKTLAVEWGNHGVRVNALCPGFTETETALKAISVKDPATVERRKSRVPLGRFAQPLDQAAAVLFLISPEASYLSGVTLPVDGGTLACHPGYSEGRSSHDV